MSKPERRRFPRFPFHSRGFLAVDGLQHLGTILDISLKGALFSAVEPLVVEPGTACRLEIFHAGREEVCNATAVVAYHREGMVGLELLDINAATRQVLEQVVLMNLGPTEMLGRDLPEMLDTEDSRSAA